MMLSKRMQAVADLVPEAACLADIGTDHGYLPIRLVQKGRVRRAIAMDVNAGPLDRASGHIEECGLGERIATRLSDGLTELGPGEADVVLIAGMGGPLTVRILERGKDVWNPAADTEPGGGSKGAGTEPGGGSKAVGSEPDGGSKAAGTEPGNGSRDTEEQDPGLTVKAIILQPQSEIPDVRRYLMGNGWRIAAENMVLEDGKFYPMMKAERGPEELTSLQLIYGPRLLEDKNPVLLSYLQHEEKTLRKVLENLEKADGGERKEARRKEVEKRLQVNAAARMLYGTGKSGNCPDAISEGEPKWTKT